MFHFDSAFFRSVLEHVWISKLLRDGTFKFMTAKELWLKQPRSRQASQTAFSSKHHVNFNRFTARVFDGIC